MTAPQREAAGSSPETSALEALGVVWGEEVRFRRSGRGRWQHGTVHRLERDGSLQVTNLDGAARSVPLADVEVRARATRQVRASWEPVADRAGRTVQLALSW